MSFKNNKKFVGNWFAFLTSGAESEALCVFMCLCSWGVMYHDCMEKKVELLCGH